MPNTIDDFTREGVETFVIHTKDDNLTFIGIEPGDSEFPVASTYKICGVQQHASKTPKGSLADLILFKRITVDLHGVDEDTGAIMVTAFAPDTGDVGLSLLHR